MDEKTIKMLTILIPIALTLVGGMITVMLAINAFFIKGLISSINEMKLQIIRLITEHGTLTALTGSHEIDIRSLREKMHKFGNDIGITKLHEIKIETLQEKVNEIYLRLATMQTNKKGVKDD